MSLDVISELGRLGACLDRGVDVVLGVRDECPNDGDHRFRVGHESLRQLGQLGARASRCILALSRGETGTASPLHQCHVLQNLLVGLLGQLGRSASAGSRHWRTRRRNALRWTGTPVSAGCRPGSPSCSRQKDQFLSLLLREIFNRLNRGLVRQVLELLLGHDLEELGARLGRHRRSRSDCTSGAASRSLGRRPGAGKRSIRTSRFSLRGTRKIDSRLGHAFAGKLSSGVVDPAISSMSATMYLSSS